MKSLNDDARKIMDILTSGLTAVGDHKEIDNAPRAFMAVHVELIATMGEGHLVSVAHYWEHTSGDLMADPEMIFWRRKDGNYFPIYFKQDGVPFVEQRSVYFQDGEPIRLKAKVQKDQTEFAEMWMRNIREQQQL